MSAISRHRLTRLAPPTRPFRYAERWLGQNPGRGPSYLLRQPLARRRPASSWNGLTLAVPSAGSGSMAEPKSWDSRERQPEPSDINEIAAFCNRNCTRRNGVCATRSCSRGLPQRWLVNIVWRWVRPPAFESTQDAFRKVTTTDQTPLEPHIRFQSAQA